MSGRFAKSQKPGLLAIGTSAIVLSAGLPSALPAAEFQPGPGQQPEETTAASSNGTPEQPPIRIELQADRQRFDSQSNLFVAEGNVSAQINGGLLQADRIEFDSNFNSLTARGSVRYRKGAQYFQAGSLRYSLIENSGVLKDVYGVLDLDSAAIDLKIQGSAATAPQGTQSPDASRNTDDAALKAFTVTTVSSALTSFTDPGIDTSWAPANSLNAFEIATSKVSDPLSISCPPTLPPIPNWHPHPWAATVWGGQSIDSNFGDTFVFRGRMRPEYLMGLTLQKRIWKAGPLALEVEGNLFGHQANKQEGGEFNQSVPFADTPAQTFGEGIVGLGARVWVQPWLNFAVVEGVSYFTANSNYERTYRENYAQLLNYMGFEVEAAVSNQLSLVGRIHHRSGAFGTYSGVREGSNAYLIGARYRWGQDPAPKPQVSMPPPLGCPDPDRSGRRPIRTLSQELETITLGGDRLPTSSTSTNPPAAPAVNVSTLSPAEQESLRAEAIAAIDQRINSIQFQQSLKIERRQGIPAGLRNSDVESNNAFGGVRVVQDLGKTQLIEGTISRWRIQAAEVKITPEGWTADRMGFTNDPFTPAQTRIDAEDVVATEAPNGDILITTQRNKLIVEDRLAVDISRTQRIRKEEEVSNRWVMGIDHDDRDGFFVGRKLKPIKLGENFELALQPQALVQRAIDGETTSYIKPGSSINSGSIAQPTDGSDLFGLEAKLTGELWGLKTEIETDISTFNPSNFLSGSRFRGQVTKNVSFPVIGPSQANLFGAYRYRAWNGSLGETDVYSALGGWLQKTGGWSWGRLGNSYIWRVGTGSYQAKSFTSTNLDELWRANAYASLNSSLPFWIGQAAAPTSEAAYRYSPTPIIPGLTLNTNLNTNLSAYGNGNRQSTFSLSGGPTLTLGTFSKPFLDFTRLSLGWGGTLRIGASPFAFDQAVDLGTLGVGLTQQIAGPLVVNAGLQINIDPNSPYYGDIIDSNFELRWQRRSYDLGFYLNPEKGIGGFRFRLHDFNFDGTGVPFVPYTPVNLPQNLDNRPF